MRYLVIFLILIVSCKKEKLQHNEGFLEGQWKLYQVLDKGGPRLAPIEEILTIKGRGLMKLEGGEDRLKEHARIVSMEELPQYATTGTVSFVFTFSIDKRTWFSKTDQLKTYQYLQYVSDFDADGNSISTLYLMKGVIPAVGDKVYRGLTGR